MDVNTELNDCSALNTTFPLAPRSPQDYNVCIDRADAAPFPNLSIGGLIMNKKERIRAVMDGGVPDRIPVMTLNFLMAAREGGITMREYRQSPAAIVRVLTEACEKYDTDGILLDVDTALLASACGADVMYPENIAAVTCDRQSRSIPQILDDLENLELEKQPRIQLYLETLERLCDWGRRNDVFIRGNADQGSFSLACMLVGMNQFLEDLLDEDCEEDIFRLLEETLRVSLKMHRLCHRAGADCTSYGNSSEGCSVISPALFRKFAKPFETRMATQLKAEGIFTICHICGSVDLILEDLTQTGCPMYELDYKTDIVRAKAVSKGHFAISGNIDPALFTTGTPEDIRRVTRALCDLYRGEGGLMIGPGCALGPNTPP